MADLEALALARHPLPEWAAFAELRAGTGYQRGSDQRFDVAAFNCWPSKRGYRVVYEMKRTRSDFRRELDQPDKRAQAEEFFHETWFATLRGVCEVDEVPDGWGLLVVTKKGDKLRQVKRARPREPSEVPYTMVLSVLRRAREDLARRPTFSFEGQEVTAEHIEQLALERTEHLRTHYRSREEKLDEIRRQLHSERHALLEPILHLKKLVDGAGHWVTEREDYSGLTTADVEHLVARAAARRVRQVVGSVRGARDELERIEKVLEEELRG